MGSFKNLNYGPFRENIRLFLQEFAEKFEDNAVPGMASWSTLLINEKKGIVFSSTPLKKPLSNLLTRSAITANSVPLKDNFLDVRTHILYGLIHCNGYGHLICINGVKAPSNFLSETDAMNIWDRICSTLCTRKVSVRDEINLRLLYVVGYGQSWKGKYESAVEYLRSLNLDKIISDFKNKSKGGRIKQIINKYRGVADIPLITLSDLLKFMLGFGGRARVQGKIENKVVKSSCQHVLKRRDNEEPTSFDALVTSIANSCRWPARRVEHVLKQIVNLLKQNKGGCDGNYGVSRYEMREELRKCVGDTGLIDFVLKSVNCFAIGNYVVRRSLNSSTRRFEFSIQEVLEEAEPDCQWPEKE
nr:PHD finger protein At2g01810-like [Coffea arabica]